LGGILFLTGIIIQAYNTWKTIKGEIRNEESMEAAVGVKA